MDMNKYRRMAGIPEVFENEKPEIIQEARTIDAKSMTKIKAALAKAADNLEDKASEAKDRGAKAMFMGDARDYDSIVKSMNAKDHKTAQRTFKNMDTAARDYIFDTVQRKDLRKLIADYLDVELLREEASNDEIEKEVNRLKQDKQYMEDLISDMLDSEGKKDNEKNRTDAYIRATGRYLHDIARENLNEDVSDWRGLAVFGTDRDGGEREFEIEYRIAKGNQLEIDWPSEEELAERGIHIDRQDIIDQIKDELHEGTEVKLEEAKKKEEKKDDKKKPTPQRRKEDKKKDDKKKAAPKKKDDKKKPAKKKAKPKTSSDDTNSLLDLPKEWMKEENEDISVDVPADVKKVLKSQIKNFEDRVKEMEVDHPTEAQEEADIGKFLGTLLKHLENGTCHHCKLASIHYSEAMGDMRRSVPPEVLTFLTTGGKVSLKDYFNVAKASK